MPKRTKVFIVTTFLHDRSTVENEIVVCDTVDGVRNYIERKVKSFYPTKDDNEYWKIFRKKFPAAPVDDDRWRIHFQHSRYVIQEGFYEN